MNDNRKSGAHLFVPAGGHPICGTCGCDEDDAFVGSQKCTYRRPRKTKNKDSDLKKVYVVCRHIVQTHMNVAVFYGVCSTEDRAQVLVDDLTKKEGPTFVIIDAPMDP